MANNNNEKWSVYILECSDGSLYIGATNDPQRRFEEHLSGKGSKYVRARKAKQIIYMEEVDNKYDAFKREREIKGYSRQKKLNLIKLSSR
jgi:putative endonuclease